MMWQREGNSGKIFYTYSSLPLSQVVGVEDPLTPCNKLPVLKLISHPKIPHIP